MASLDGALAGGIGLAAVLGLVLSVTGLAVGAWLTWHNVPVVGGEWWFYIRAAATVIGAVVGAKVGGIVGYFMGIVGGAFVGGILG